VQHNLEKNRTKKLESLKRLQLSILFIGCLLASNLSAQIGGAEVFEFLELPGSARVSGLAGSAITVLDDDLNLSLGNPALINSTMHKQIAFNHSFHLAGTDHGYVAFGYHHDQSKISFNGGIQYMSYGDFVQADEFGNAIGDFKANEFGINIGASKLVFERLRVGANLKFITSQLESYNSLGIATDIGAHYQDTSGRTTFALVIKNIGTQITTYSPDNREALPFDIQFGVSKRLKHLPFRIGLTVHNLHRGNLVYDDPNVVEPTSLFGNEEISENKVGVFVDNLFRHTIFNGEFLLGKKENFNIRFGYNHFRRRELTVSTASRSLAGFSLGFGFMVKRFKINYGHQFYAIAGGNNHISITTKLGRW